MTSFVIFCTIICFDFNNCIIMTFITYNLQVRRPVSVLCDIKCLLINVHAFVTLTLHGRIQQWSACATGTVGALCVRFRIVHEWLWGVWPATCLRYSLVGFLSRPIQCSGLWRIRILWDELQAWFSVFMLNTQVSVSAWQTVCCLISDIG